MEKVLEYSKKIWNAIQSKDIEFLAENTYPETVFVHMGANIPRDEELEVIRTGRIEYKQIDVEEVNVKAMDSIVIVFTKMKLTAVVGGNEVVNPFMVTEVYSHNEDVLKLATLAFTKILY